MRHEVHLLATDPTRANNESNQLSRNLDGNFTSISAQVAPMAPIQTPAQVTAKPVASINVPVISYYHVLTRPQKYITMTLTRVELNTWPPMLGRFFPSGESRIKVRSEPSRVVRSQTDCKTCCNQLHPIESSSPNLSFLPNGGRPIESFPSISRTGRCAI